MKISEADLERAFQGRDDVAWRRGESGGWLICAETDLQLGLPTEDLLKAEVNVESAIAELLQTDSESREIAGTARALAVGAAHVPHDSRREKSCNPKSLPE